MAREGVATLVADSVGGVTCLVDLVSVCAVKEREREDEREDEGEKRKEKNKKREIKRDM